MKVNKLNQTKKELQELLYSNEVLRIAAEAEWNKIIDPELKIIFQDIKYSCVPFERVNIDSFCTIFLLKKINDEVITEMKMVIPETNVSNDNARLLFKMQKVFRWWVEGKFIFLQKVNELYYKWYLERGINDTNDTIERLQNKINKIEKINLKNSNYVHN